MQFSPVTEMVAVYSSSLSPPPPPPVHHPPTLRPPPHPHPTHPHIAEDLCLEHGIMVTMEEKYIHFNQASIAAALAAI